MITYFENHRLIKQGRWDGKKSSDKVEVVARWLKMRKGGGTQFDELEGFLSRLRYGDPDADALRIELANLDSAIKELRVLPVEAKWISEWCRATGHTLARVERFFRAVRYAKWTITLLAFLNQALTGEGTFGYAVEAGSLISEAPSIENRYKPILKRLALAAFGMPSSSGRYVLLASSSLRNLKNAITQREAVERRLSHRTIENHFWPYLNRLGGRLGAHSVIP